MIPTGILCTDRVLPTGVFTSPAAGFVSGVVTLALNAADNDKVASVQFYIGGTPIGGPISSPPFTVAYDTNPVGNGNFTFQAVIFDRVGNAASPNPHVDVTVSNAPPAVPPVYGTNGGVNSGETLTGVPGPYFNYGQYVAAGHTLQFRFYANFDNPEGKGLLMYGYFDDGASFSFNPSADAPANGGNTTDWYGPWTNVPGSASSPQLRARLDLMREFGGGSQTNIHGSQIQFQWV